MNIMGKYVDALDFPVCNAFKPQILDGELCYGLDLSSIKSVSKMNNEAGRGNGLLLAIDTGISIEPRIDKITKEKERGFIRTKLKSTGKRARLHILTSHRHRDSRPGIYTLKDLKLMTGTDNFLAMPDDMKKCQIEPTEECRRRRYVQEVQSKCGCIPWSLSALVSDQVENLFGTHHFKIPGSQNLHS